MRDRWERVKDLFEAALEHSGDGRAAFLDEECKDDGALRSEVESLLVEYEQAGSFLHEPAGGLPDTLNLPGGLVGSSSTISVRAARRQSEVHQALCGRTISHYQIHEQIGHGGMGSVYRAVDLKSGCEVALKVLTAGPAADRTAVQRFRREGRIASALIHPNICTVFDIDEVGGTAFIVMELLRGQTLQQSIFAHPSTGTAILDNTPLIAMDTGEGRAFDTPTLLRISLEVLEALSAAHAMDVVHRDIKPANIFLTREGSVKILDFGLAKFIRTALSASTQDQTEITKIGTTLGTIMYMPPEQIRGEEVDARADLFSLGAVMFEMATGRRAFEGRFSAQILNSIINHNLPPVHEIRPELPARLSTVIGKAVEKNRERRYRSAKEMAKDVARLVARGS